MYNVLIVDDQKSSRELLKYNVLEDEEYNIVGEIQDASKTLEFCKRKKVDLILMDIYTAGKENGIKNAKIIKQKMPNIKIIIVTYMVQPEHIEEAKNIKLEGFWFKDYGDKTLLEVMDNVVKGNCIYPDKIPAVKIGEADIGDFTKQEINVLRLKVNGYSNAETCEKLGITKSTLDFHISNIKSKTGYDNMLKLTIEVAMKKFIIADEKK